MNLWQTSSIHQGKIQNGKSGCQKEGSRWRKSWALWSQPEKVSRLFPPEGSPKLSELRNSVNSESFQRSQPQAPFPRSFTHSFAHGLSLPMWNICRKHDLSAGWGMSHSGHLRNGGEAPWSLGQGRCKSKACKLSQKSGCTCLSNTCVWTVLLGPAEGRK